MLDFLGRLLRRDGCRMNPRSIAEAAADAENSQQEEAKEEAKEERAPQKEPESYTTYACPFCGQGVLSFVSQTQATGGRHDGTHYTLCCEYCGARGPLAATKPDCVAKWNKPALKHNDLADRYNALEKERDELAEKVRELEARDPEAEMLKEALKPSPLFWQTVVRRCPSRKPPKPSRTPFIRRRKSA